MDELSAPVLVGQDQECGHDGDHGEHDSGISQRLPGQGAHVVCLLVEGRVDQVGALLRVVSDGRDGGDHHGHAEGNWTEEFYHVMRSILKTELLLLLHHDSLHPLILVIIHG